MTRGDLLGAVCFGGDSAAANVSHGFPSLTLPIRTFGAGRVEAWRSASPVHARVEDGIAIARNDDVLFASAVRGNGTIEDATRDVYTRLIALARAEGYPHFLRIWNHVRGINEQERELERYRYFCTGRFDAFESHGYALRGDLPAASAVGMRAEGLAVFAIASRTPATQIENPRQVSAYDYPLRYGPRSPSFSRATVATFGSDKLVFVSGTASVVGHETKHVGNVAGQIEETLHNLERVLEVAGATLDDLVAVKTYVRHADDHDAVARVVDHTLPRAQRLYVHADICRADLLLEMEGVARRSE